MVAPDFDREDFPGATAYNLGGVVDDSGDPRPVSDWTFAYIGPLAERVRAMTGVREAWQGETRVDRGEAFDRLG